MAVIRNNDIKKELQVNIHSIKPREKVVTPFYSWDPAAEIVDHEEGLWKFDVTGEPWMDAIVGSTIVTLPADTVEIEIYNGSANLLKIYNYKKDLVTPEDPAVPGVLKKNFPILIPPFTVRTRPVKRRVFQLEVVGSCAAGEVSISFSSTITPE